MNQISNCNSSRVGELPFTNVRKRKVNWMKIPQLQLTITDAQIGLTIPKAQQEMEQPPADLQIEQPAAELTISTKEGFLEMDATQFWSDLGFRSIPELVKAFAQKGHQDVQEGIARRAREGGQLANIANGGNPLAEISKSKNRNLDIKPLGITFIPSYQSIKLHYNPADVQVDVKRNDPVIDVNINKPIYKYTPGNVQVDLLQQPSVKIDWLV